MLIHLTNTKGDVVVIDTTTQDFNVFLGAADPENVDPVNPLLPAEPDEEAVKPSIRTTTELEIQGLIKSGFFKRSKTIKMITSALNSGDNGDDFHSKTEISNAINFFLLNYQEDLAVRKVRGATIYYAPVELKKVKGKRSREAFLTPSDE